MYGVNVSIQECYKLLFRDAFKTATLCDGLRALELEGEVVTRYMHLCGTKLGVRGQNSQDRNENNT
jgi:hypothetical protein